MKFESMTFGQLYKLTHPVNTLRMARAYHQALRRRWNQVDQKGARFSVRAAEVAFPKFSEPWKRVLAELELHKHLGNLKSLADVSDVPRIPGMTTLVREVPFREFPADPKRAERLAAVIRRFCLCCGVPAWVGWNSRGHQVFAETNQLGAAILLYKSGLSVTTLLGFLNYKDAIEFSKLFWWLPAGYTGIFNPLWRPVNTPDIHETVHQYLFGPGQIACSAA